MQQSIQRTTTITSNPVQPASYEKVKTTRVDVTPPIKTERLKWFGI